MYLFKGVGLGSALATEGFANGGVYAMAGKKHVFLKKTCFF